MSVPAALETLARERDLGIALLVRAGSKAYGIDVEGSDDDYAGVFVPRLRRLVSLRGLEQDTYAANGPDFTLHEIAKLCHVALKGNPAIPEPLTPTRRDSVSS